MLKVFKDLGERLDQRCGMYHSYVCACACNSRVCVCVYVSLLCYFYLCQYDKIRSALLPCVFIAVTIKHWNAL